MNLTRGDYIEIFSYISGEKSIARVTGFFDDDVEFAYRGHCGVRPYEDCAPIPLTLDILKGNLFKVCDTVALRVVKIADDIYIHVMWGDGILSIKEVSGDGSVARFNGRVDSVHELQHVLSCCRIDGLIKFVL